MGLSGKRPLGSIAPGSLVGAFALPIRIFTVLALVMTCMFAVQPHAALADNGLSEASSEASFVSPQKYSRVNISAQVQTTSEIHVAEQRTFELGSANAVVTWQLSDLPDDASFKVNAVRIACVDAEGNVQGNWVSLSEAAFTLSWREGGGPRFSAYSIDSPKDTAYVFIGADASDGANSGAVASDSGAGSASGSEPVSGAASSTDFEPTPNSGAESASESRSVSDANEELALPATQLVVELDYSIVGGITVYDDMAQLIWEYVSDESTAVSENVSFNVSLPVASGASVSPGVNVFAWGHGPADGVLSANPDATVTCEVPRVGIGQYSEVRILFPEEWLTNISASSAVYQRGLIAETARSEEASWVDSDSARRHNDLLGYVALVGACACALLLAFVAYACFGRPRALGVLTSDRSVSRETLLDAVHPAVVGRLCRWNRESSRDVAVSLVRLAQAGAVYVEVGVARDDARPRCSEAELGSSPSGSSAGDWCIAVNNEVAAAQTDGIDRATLNLLFHEIAQGPVLRPESVRAFEQEHPQRFEKLMAAWQKELSKRVSSEGVFDAKSFRAQKVMAVVALLFVLVGAIVAFLLGNAFVAVVAIPTGLALGLVANYMPRRTDKGINLAACCDALRESWRGGHLPESSLALAYALDSESAQSVAPDVVRTADALALSIDAALGRL